MRRTRHLVEWHGELYTAEPLKTLTRVSSLPPVWAVSRRGEFIGPCRAPRGDHQGVRGSLREVAPGAARGSISPDLGVSEFRACGAGRCAGAKIPGHGRGASRVGRRCDGRVSGGEGGGGGRTGGRLGGAPTRHVKPPSAQVFSDGLRPVLGSRDHSVYIAYTLHIQVL